MSNEKCGACRKQIVSKDGVVHQSCHNMLLQLKQDSIKEKVKSAVDKDLEELKDKFWGLFSEFKEEYLLDAEAWDKYQELLDTFDEIITTKRIREPIEDLYYFKPLYRRVIPEWQSNLPTEIVASYYFSFTSESIDQIKRSLEGWIGLVLSNNSFSYILEHLSDYFYGKANLIIDNLWITSRIQEELNKGNFLISKHLF